MKSILKVSNFNARYGKADIIENLSLEIPEGQIVTVIGPNGAGKSTLVNGLMASMESPGYASGNIQFFDQDISRVPVEAIVRLGISLVPETRELFGSMTVLENLQLGAYVRRKRGEKNYFSELEKIYGLFPRLKERQGQRSSTLSGGERQMLAVGRALMAQPKLLILDEPSLGLAPRITQEIFHILGRLKELGMSTLLIEQNARAALKISDYGYVMELGRFTMSGPSDELANDPSVIETYLGFGKKKESKQ
ncbi:MAG TPA: ABC transporter ATP-binding protein [Marinospirillum sp.]|uniref:ABC transporter ATP-binding protein n=1 Tax=Marinospirillum sp. TaxID=2183934 RepID=UPI002B49A1DA|nr:ABC transporter ATP-binding protein [Marinospirillum sp.]HKM16585.1 ABC transporter ATP-binding protein [Marinospirillum sp.]